MIPLISKLLSLITVMNFAILQVIPFCFSQNQYGIHVLNMILGRYKNVSLVLVIQPFDFASQHFGLLANQMVW